MRLVGKSYDEIYQQTGWKHIGTASDDAHPMSDNSYVSLTKPEIYQSGCDPTHMTVDARWIMDWDVEGGGGPDGFAMAFSHQVVALGGGMEHCDGHQNCVTAENYETNGPAVSAGPLTTSSTSIRRS